MKVSEITRILAGAGLPALSRDQLLELAGTKAGKRFEAALIAFGAGDHAHRDELEATVKVLSAETRSALQRAGSALAVDQLVAIACAEQRRFFDALDAVVGRTPRAAGARTYLSGLGIGAANCQPPVPARPPYHSFKIFGASAALCVSEARTRAGNQHTIQIEGAPALAGAARKAYDWPNKVALQLTIQEAYQALAIFESKIRSVKFDGHGDRHDKSLHIEFQQHQYFVKITQRGKAAVAVPVRPVDAIQIVSLLYKQIRLNDPHLEIGQIRAFTDQLAQMSTATNA